MNLSFHEDWPAAAANLERFWRGESLGRPAMHLTADRPADQRPPIPEPSSPEEKYLSLEFLCAQYEATLGGRYFLAEALPCTSGLMAGWLPAYGAPLQFMPDTIWINPIIEDWERAPDLEQTWDNDQWGRLLRIVRGLGEFAEGKFLVGIPPILPPNDLLSMLREVNRFLLDLIEHPDEIKHALRVMTANWLKMFDALADLAAERFVGLHHHYPVWHPQRICVTQSDVSCMISPATFEEFIVPELEEMTQAAGPAIYHLDGPDAIRHLDRVLDLPGVAMLQWVPGAGRPGGFEHWMSLFKRAQERGKKIFLPVSLARLETAIREFVPEQTFMVCHAPDLASAYEALAQAEAWTREYWG